MTKRRFKFSLAALGLMIVFLLALMGLLLAPTLASADKNTGNAHNNSHNDTPNGHKGSGINPIYFQNGNGSDGDQGHKFGSTDFCAPGADCFGVGDKGTSDGSPDPGGNSGGDPDHSSDGSGGGPQGGQGNGFPSGYFGGGSFGGGSDSGSPGQTDHDGTGPDGTGPDGNGPGGDGPDGSGHGPHIPDLKIDVPDDDTPLLPDFDKPPFTDPPPGDGPPVTSLVAPQQVPEPLTLSLFAVGLAGTAALRRRRKSK